VTQPDVTQPDVTQPDVTQPDVTQPDVTQPDVTQPDVTQPDVTQPDVTQPDVTQPDVTQPDVTDAWEPDWIAPEDGDAPVDVAADVVPPDAAWNDTSDVVEQPPLEFALMANELYINCMPIVGPDPILGSFMSDTLNPGTGMFPGDIMIVEARLEVTTDQVSEVYYFTVDPQMVSVDSMTGIQTTHQKNGDSLLSNNNTLPCQLCEGEWTLVVTVWQGSIGLETQKSLGPAPVQCVY
jgi:hypothetical protein